MAANYTDERKRLAGRLKQYHDWNFTPGAYEHSIFGVAAKLLEVDAVEVVRCKGCRFRTEPGQPNILCHQMKDDDFCSYGERKKGE